MSGLLPRLALRLLHGPNMQSRRLYVPSIFAGFHVLGWKVRLVVLTRKTSPSWWTMMIRDGFAVRDAKLRTATPDRISDCSSVQLLLVSLAACFSLGSGTLPRNL